MTMIGRVTNHRREISKGQKAEHGNNEHALHSGGPQQETERKKIKGKKATLEAMGVPPAYHHRPSGSRVRVSV